MTYFIEEKQPYVIIGGKPLKKEPMEVTEEEFWQEMKKKIGEGVFEHNEVKISNHMKGGRGSFIEYGNYIFTTY